MNADRFNLRSLYLYTVCLVTLLISIFSIASTVRSAVDLAYPDPYIEMPARSIDEMTGEPLTDEQVAIREQENEISRRSQRRWAVLELIRSSTLLGVAAPAYLYHWRRVQRDRREDRSADA